MKRIRIGKYLTNFSVIAAALAAFGVMRQSREMPKDWRIGVLWLVWLLGLVLAIAGVAKRDEDKTYRHIHE